MEAGDAPDIPDDALLVRGGKMKVETIKVAIDTYRARVQEEGAALSAWYFPECDEEGAANMLPTMHRHYRTALAGDLRGAGFMVEATGRRGHVTIKFPGSGTDEEIERLLDCFSAEAVRPQYS